MQTTGPITIPEGFFPPPGVPFTTADQRDLAIVLHRIGKVKLQLEWATSKWNDAADNELQGTTHPQYYRIAPPKPRTVGPFESVCETSTHNCSIESAYAKAMNAAVESGMKRVRIKLTATAEEILP